MKKPATLLTLGCILLWTAAAVVTGQVSNPPLWAYGFTAEGPEPAAPPCTETSKPQDCARAGSPRPKDVVHTLPDAARTFTEYEIHNGYGPADWYPGDHPPMPDIVAHGRESDKLRACALCHLPNGQGKPENAPVAGLSAAYIVQQLQAFKSGLRQSAEPRKANTNEMIQIARHMTDAEIKEVAAYFSSMTWRPWIKVVETETVPKTRPDLNGLFIPEPGGATEPLGKRIIEVPENPEFTEKMRSPRSGFIAYVPPGSLKRGEELVTKGGGKTTACVLCHGPELQGAGITPPIADRHASYIARQLVDMQFGTRESPMMKSVVPRLNEDDIIAIAAYVASK
ncbi:MAG: hypothetical protein A3F70_08955 [Acidobacteria bacterium RIFCSPLOWO2_12_FULL_67_14]|nr:MAG: hypothetical protein A3H29_12620 [Acidobacteria bacterium RIFCSPLOWO2_02_FULL_67_21]OFW40036.1 MAG: hypothetical protein A3F70_08955 [Acidobacteria bacterium RIFCSPLOWO2_12_FULL_67_14]